MLVIDEYLAVAVLSGTWPAELPTTTLRPWIRVNGAEGEGSQEQKQLAVSTASGGELLEDRQVEPQLDCRTAHRF